MSAHEAIARRAIRENLATIIQYAISIEPVRKFVDVTFEGEWDELRDTVLRTPRERAERSCIELAVFLRYLDDEKLIAPPLRDGKELPFGWLVVDGGNRERLNLRQVTNKIIHAQRLEWDVAQTFIPKLICFARQDARIDGDWISAEIQLPTLAAVCGRLA